MAGLLVKGYFEQVSQQKIRWQRWTILLTAGPSQAFQFPAALAHLCGTNHTATFQTLLATRSALDHQGTEPRAARG
jgi:hypothetical protein